MIIEKGVTFGEIHSYHDLNLILNKYEITPAKAKTKYVDIPGGDGSADLTEANGEVTYEDRECTFNFTVHPLDNLTWEEKKTEICNLLSGLKCKITIDKDDDYYYEGRCEINDYLCDKNLKEFVIKAKVFPYKFKHNLTTITVNLSATSKDINLINGRKPVSPSIICTNDNTIIEFKGVTYNLSAGTHKFLDIYLKQGNNPLTITGIGTVTFQYQEGDL